MRYRVRPVARLQGSADVPGDKSISHRAALLGALGAGRTEVQGFLEGEDCLRTLAAVRALGCEVTRKAPGHYLLDGLGLDGLSEPQDVIDCGNSGTTARLLAGVLAGQPFWTVLTGDDSLRRRPMGRVAAPLRRMGASVGGRQDGSRLPLAIGGRRPLHALHHVSPVASAQVKSALLLAGLYADGPVTVEEPAPSRDHTERMLGAFGARIERTDGHRVTLTPGAGLRGQSLHVPGDLSSAAFLLVPGILAAAGSVTVERVGVNPTRTGLLEALEAMGGRLRSTPGGGGGGGEPSASLTATPSALQGVEIGGSLIPRLIDEVPVLAVAACGAEGVTRIRGAGELRLKESDRIQAIAAELGRMGARITELPDGLEIQGRVRLRGATVDSRGDHRMAMALTVAGLGAAGETVVEDTACVATSFPGFLAALNALAGEPCAIAEP